MFIDTTDTLMKSVVNTEHITRILRIIFTVTAVLINSVLQAHSPDAARTQHLTHRCTIQLR